MLNTLAAVILLLSALYWLLFTALTLRSVLLLRRLPHAPPLPPDAPRPAVTAVVAVRDGADRIEGTLRGLLAQRHVDIRVVAVDDRSTDGTPAILARLAAEDPRLTPVRVDALPEGWLGKCHAMHTGARHAPEGTDWILFTDADIHLAPEIVHHAAARARADGVAHLALTPTVFSREVNPSFFSRSCLLCIMLPIALHIAQANADSKNGHGGVGAFNMVRADVYRRFGGHEPLRMEVMDDYKLGLLVRRAGERTRIYIGAPDVEAHWAGSAVEIVRVLEKNMFAGTDFSLARAIFFIATGLGAWLAAALGPLLHPWLGWVALGSLLTIIVPAAVQARGLRWPPPPALLAPLGVLILPTALAWSTYRTVRQGGVRWRGTLYPTAQLRASMVR